MLFPEEQTRLQFEIVFFAGLHACVEMGESEQGCLGEVGGPPLSGKMMRTWSKQTITIFHVGLQVKRITCQDCPTPKHRLELRQG